jgi:transposase
MSLSTVVSIVNVFKVGGRSKPLKRGGARRRKLGEDDKLFIKELVDQDCQLTLKEIKQKLTSEKSVEVTEARISQVLQDFEYTVKLVERVPVGRNSVTTIERRKE